MSDVTGDKRVGCGQGILNTTLIFWFGLAPIGVAALSGSALDGVPALAIALGALVLLGPFVALALLVRRRDRWKTTAALASALTIAAGYLLLDAVLAELIASDAIFTPLRKHLLIAAVRLATMIPYALFAAWLAPRLAGRAPGRLWDELGLNRLRWSTTLLALALAAVVTLPWPLTGALGDSLDSLGLTLQMLARVVPWVLLGWGVIFPLLTAASARTWTAALATILIAALATVGGLLPGDNWNALGDALLLLPAAFLLTELRARERSSYPLLLFALLYRVTAVLFVDPRDALAQGIPEPQHILAHGIAMLSATALGLALWVGRRILLKRRERSAAQPVGPSRQGVAVLALIAFALWSSWGGLYVVAGEPGFANHGFLIILKEQANLSDAADVTGREERLRFVYETLTTTAERTQAPLRAELDELGVPYRPYYIINMIRVDGHRRLQARFEDRPEVAEVILNPNVRNYPRRIPIPYGGDSLPVEEVQANLAAIHADAAWAMDVTGRGIVVGGQDTGYDWEHPALQPHYRGWDGQTADHNYNWHDAWGDAAVPFDDGSHGTHTMGTVVGDDGGDNRTGVAPGAAWIGCRNMRRGFGNPGAYAECMEFFLAPYPHGGDPFTDGDVTKTPHVTNNSWGCPTFEGCFPDTLKPAVEALRAAGVMMVVSAGNDGPACNTASTPPANYDAAFSVGATSNGGTITSFSSRGPVDGLLKPDVSAPGENVRSSTPGGGYGYAGGTSMAGPHVAGVVALLWSANPALVGDIGATEALICQTATAKPVEDLCTAEEESMGTIEGMFTNPICACGGTTGAPNNVYGCGVINAGEVIETSLEMR